MWPMPSSPRRQTAPAMPPRHRPVQARRKPRPTPRRTPPSRPRPKVRPPAQPDEHPTQPGKHPVQPGSPWWTRCNGGARSPASSSRSLPMRGRTPPKEVLRQVLRKCRRASVPRQMPPPSLPPPSLLPPRRRRARNLRSRLSPDLRSAKPPSAAPLRADMQADGRMGGLPPRHLPRAIRLLNSFLSATPPTAPPPRWRMAAALVLEQLRARMAQPEYASAPTLGLLYITDHYVNEARALLDHLSGELPGVTDWSGTVGVGVAANNAEYFDQPGLSVMLLDVPADQYRVFSGVAPLPTHRRNGGFAAHTALVHADGHTPELAQLLAEMAARTDTGYLFGGLSASRTASGQVAVGGGGNMAGQGGAGGVFDAGLSGVAFGAGVALVSRVTQGCQPVSALHRITAAQNNLVLTLDDKPALDMLLDTLGVSLESDPQPALRKVRATLAGLVDAGEQPRGQRRMGHFGTDTRVRHIVGLDGL